MSVHQDKNVDSPERLRMLLDCVNAVYAHFEMPVFVSTHLRTRKRLESLPDWSEPEGIKFSEPLGFHNYSKLQLSAACCLSDSGTIAEGSTLTCFPTITLLDSIERPEALDTGGVVISGLDAEVVVVAAGLIMASGYERHGVSDLTPDDYLIENARQSTVQFILTMARRHNHWAGIRTHGHTRRHTPR